MAPTNDMVSIGYGNIIRKSRILVVALPDAAPIRRMIQVKKEENMCMDCTNGRKTRSVILLDNDWIVLSSLKTQNIMNRLNGVVTVDVEEDEDEIE